MPAPISAPGTGCYVFRAIQPPFPCSMAFSSLSRGRPHQWLFSIAALLIGLAFVLATSSQGQEIGRLYATRPPPGYSFIRIAALAGGAAPRVQVNAAELSLGADTGVSSYRAVPGQQKLNLVVDGVAASPDIVPASDTYLTLVISKTSAGWTVQSIDEGLGASDGLKARLRFFNLAPGCAATLKIADGPTIFQQAAFVSMQSRTINPVTAKLEGSCGEAPAELTLPQLRAGDSYSLFLRKDSDQLRLTGRLDETEPYRER